MAGYRILLFYNIKPELIASHMSSLYLARVKNNGRPQGAVAATRRVIVKRAHPAVGSVLAPVDPAERTFILLRSKLDRTPLAQPWPLRLIEQTRPYGARFAWNA